MRNSQIRNFISIHAPPRGATNAVISTSTENGISIHAPPRGATRFKLSRSSLRSYFNSRPSARGDPCRFACCFLAFCISIHAPPRGATQSCTALVHSHRISIHAPPRGATDRRRHATRVDRNFNSRPSARGDSCRATATVARSNFNSRPSARGDGWLVDEREPVPISIHAPPRGATEPRRLADRVANAFQFTPLREGRLLWLSDNVCPANFNSRPSARGDRAAERRRLHPRISIHAPPRGATAKDMQFLQIFCSTLTNQHGLTIVPRNLSRLFW